HQPEDVRGAQRTLMDTMSAASSTAPLVRSEICPGCSDLMDRLQVVACDPVIGRAHPAVTSNPDATWRLSDPLILGGQCTTCGRALHGEEPAHLLLAREQDDSLSVCPA